MNLLEEEYRHEDKRRTLIQLFTAEIKQVNLYKVKKGSTLGEHYHKRTTEYFYVIHGTLIYNDSRLVETGDLFVVNPQESHKIEAIADTELMTFLTVPFDEESPDLWKS